MQYVIGVRGEPERLTSAARVLEMAGYDGVSYGDHRADAARPHVFTTLAAVATGTERVQIVSGFANNLFRHPAEFAQAALSIHSISGGRFEAGIGAGWTRGELEAIGQPLPRPAERVARLAEACEIARPLMRGEACRYEGAYYQANFDAVPDRDGPPPPLVAAVGGPVACRRIAPLVDRVEVMFGPAVAGGFLDFDIWKRLSADDLRRRIDIAREASPSVKVGVGVFVAAGASDDVAALAARAGDSLQSKLIGEPTAVADGLRSLKELGVDRVGITPMTSTTGLELGEVLLTDR